MIAKAELEKMGLAELQGLKEAVEAVLAEKANAEMAQLQKRMAELKALGGDPRRPQQQGEGRTRASPKPKYRSLKNPETVWTGRGATPNWLKAEMEETKKPQEAFLIAETA
ncbi:H-NS family nucleoid-associated regulatory protein [Jiella pelagia]|uniref:H-NS family nucleoid-associated regulatory protein n=1 Tax=Jiella pelagia TaxID=2986949 RepID=A0ABY7C010_9HYPH|nr:H-NS family nucleoid-associated regulatory protein [Jiella pelagia]WAP69072.1 H-NS family nucleoid-associated regulatory protein [Jiella pelagia]